MSLKTVTVIVILGILINIIIYIFDYTLMNNPIIFSEVIFFKGTLLLFFITLYIKQRK